MEYYVGIVDSESLGSHGFCVGGCGSSVCSIHVCSKMAGL